MASQNEKDKTLLKAAMSQNEKSARSRKCENQRIEKVLYRAFGPALFPIEEKTEARRNLCDAQTKLKGRGG
jgi:hypothetical protein